MVYRNVVFNTPVHLTGEHDKWGFPVNFSARLDLLWIGEACDRVPGFAAAAWKLQDGYGEAGFTPDQGWDWSGIRDSTEGAIAAMFKAAREALPGFDAELGCARWQA